MAILQPNRAIAEPWMQLAVGGAHKMTVSWRGAACERFGRG